MTKLIFYPPYPFIEILNSPGKHPKLGNKTRQIRNRTNDWQSQKPGGQEADSRPRCLGQHGKKEVIGKRVIWGAVPVMVTVNLSCPLGNNGAEK